MGQYRFVTLPNGQRVVADNNTTDDQAYTYWGFDPTPPAPQGDGSRNPWAAGTDAAVTGLTAGLPYAVQKATGNLTPQQESDYQNALKASATRQQTALPGGPTPVGLNAQLPQALYENLAYSAPQMVSETAGALGGAALGAAATPEAGGAGAIPGAFIGAAAVGTPQYVGSNVTSATQGGQQALTDTQAQHSLEAAPVQGAIDAGLGAIGGRYIPGVGKALGAAETGFTGNFLSRAAKTGALEAGVGATDMVGREVGTRYASDQPLADSDAINEYGQAAGTGAILGGVLGGAAGGFKKGKTALPPTPPLDDAGPKDLLRLPAPEQRQLTGPDDTEGTPPPPPGQLTGPPPAALPAPAARPDFVGDANGNNVPIPPGGGDNASILKSASPETGLQTGEHQPPAGAQYAAQQSEKVDAYRPQPSPEPPPGPLVDPSKPVTDPLAGTPAGQQLPPVFSQASLVQAIRGDSPATSFVTKLANDLSIHLRNQDTQGLHDLLYGQIDRYDNAPAPQKLAIERAVNVAVSALNDPTINPVEAAKLTGGTLLTGPEARPAVTDQTMKAQVDQALQKWMSQDQDQDKTTAPAPAPGEDQVQQGLWEGQYPPAHETIEQHMLAQHAPVFEAAARREAEAARQAAFRRQAIQSAKDSTNPGSSADKFHKIMLEHGQIGQLSPEEASDMLAHDNAKERTQNMAVDAQQTQADRDHAQQQAQWEAAKQAQPTYIKPPPREPLPENAFRPASKDPGQVVDEVEQFLKQADAKRSEVVQTVATAIRRMNSDHNGLSVIDRRKVDQAMDRLVMDHGAKVVDEAMDLAAKQEHEEHGQDTGQAASNPEELRSAEPQDAGEPAAVPAERNGGGSEDAGTTGASPDVEPRTEPEPEGRTDENPQGDQERAPEQTDQQAGDRDGVSEREAGEQAGPVETPPLEDHKPADTHEAVLKDADQMLKQGQLTAKQRAQIATLAEQGHLSPAQVRKRMNDAYERNLSNAFGKRTNGKPADTNEAAQMAERDARIKSLRRRLDNLGLHGVGLKVQTALEAIATRGHDTPFYNHVNNVINVVLGGEDAMHVLNHELFHALETMGVLTRQELDIIDRAAARDKDVQNFVNQPAYSDAEVNAASEGRVSGAEARTSEGRAELFARSQLPPKVLGPLGSILAKVNRFAEAFGNWIRGNGWKTADDVFADINRGVMGNRESGGSTMYGGKNVMGRASGAEERAEDTGVRGRANDDYYAMRDNPDDIKDTMRASSEDIMTNLKSSARKVIVDNLSSMRQLIDRYGDKMPELKQIWDALTVTTAKRDSMIHDDGHVLDALRSLEPAERKTLTDLMLDAEEHQTNVADGKGTSPLHQRYNGMSGPAQEVYKSIQRSFRSKVDQFIENDVALMKTNGKLATPEAEAAYRAKLGAQFKGVYVPHVWIGDHILIGKSKRYVELQDQQHASNDKLAELDPKSQDYKDQLAAHEKILDAMEAEKGQGYVVTAHETPAARDRMKADLEKQGLVTETREKKAYMSDTDAVSSRFMREQDKGYEEMIAAHPEAREALEGMQKMSKELFYSFRPDGSQLAGRLRRKGVAGFSTDMGRVFSIASKRDAGYLANMAHGQEIKDQLASMDAAAKGDPALATVAAHVIDHFNSIGKSANQPTLRFLNNMTYAYMLGASPSFLVMHLMQTPMITAPWLYGKTGKVGNGLLEAFAHTVGKIGEHGLEAGNEHLYGRTADEQAMLKYLASRNIIASTHTSTVMRGAEKDTALGRAGHAIMDAATYLPEKTEKVNRIASALAAYKAALENPHVVEKLTPEELEAFRARGGSDGLTDEQLMAARFAETCVADTHVDYSKENAAGIFQTSKVPLGQLMFQFQKYQQGMVHLLASQGMDMFNGEKDKATRAAAMRTLMGVLATHGVMTGAMGLPLVGTGMFLMNMYHKFLGDQDEPFDAEDSLRRFFDKTFGSVGGNVLLRGALYNPLTKDAVPADITDRLGLGDMLSPGSTVGKIDRQDLLQYMGSVLSGPTGSLLGQFADAYKFSRQGDQWKAGEQLMPKVMRDVSKTMRFYNDGVTTASNNLVMSKEQMTPSILATQALGFQPQPIEEAYANRGGVENAKAELTARRTELLKMVTDARMSGNPDAVQAAMAHVRAFNAERGQDGLYHERINGNEMTRSYMNRRMGQVRLRNGVSLGPTERRLAQYEVNNPDEGQ